MLSTSQSINGQNMFTYCADNPVMNVDKNGKWTFSLGTTFQGGLLFGGSFYINIFSIDGNGDFSLFTGSSVSDGVCAGGSLGAGATFTFTQKDNINKLVGKNSNLGSDFLIYGVDAIGDDNGIYGGSFSIGPSIGADSHLYSSKNDDNNYDKVAQYDACEVYSYGTFCYMKRNPLDDWAWFYSDGTIVKSEPNKPGFCLLYYTDENGAFHDGDEVWYV